jgi:hypothetical protein
LLDINKMVLPNYNSIEFILSVYDIKYTIKGILYRSLNNNLNQFIAGIDTNLWLIQITLLITLSQGFPTFFT